MEIETGAQLSQEIRKKITELKDACAGIDEKTASRAPEGRWTPKEILSHLLGSGESTHVHFLQNFLDKETPTLEIDIANPFFTEKRAQSSFADLLSQIENEYEKIAAMAAKLTESQLSRNAHIPQLKESPLGEYPTLAGMIKGLGEFHVQMHIDHLREILQQPAR